MLQIDNRTPWAAGLFPGYDLRGRFQFTAVLKAGFSFDAAGRLSPRAGTCEIEPADRYRGTPGCSSLAAAGEGVPFKQGGELLLSGTARPPVEGRTVMEVSVGLRRPGGARWEKKVRVFGPRRWQKSLLSTTPGPPGPLEPLPLVYEHAFGGADSGNPEKIFAANPAGQGFSDKGWRAGSLPLPRIEIGPNFLTAPGQRVAPAGFGPIPPLWEPRLSLFQGLDLDSEAPGGGMFGSEFPADLWNQAPLDQRFGQPFSGGEQLCLRGLVEGAGEDGVVLELPALCPELHLVVGGHAEGLHPRSDTLLIDADRCHLDLLWRVGIPWGLTWTKKGWIVLREREDSHRLEND